MRDADVLLPEAHASWWNLRVDGVISVVLVHLCFVV